MLVGIRRRDSKHDVPVLVMGVGHYGLLKVPDLLTSSFCLYPDQFFDMPDELLVVVKLLLVEVFVLVNAVTQPLQLYLHFNRNSGGSLSQFADSINGGSWPDLWR